jgi:hypothetical protein
MPEYFERIIEILFSWNKRKSFIIYAKHNYQIYTLKQG